LTRRVFITGAPRSGTTYVSDWITEIPSCYCAHEVIQAHAKSEACALDNALFEYARTASDRLSKPGQRAFMRWDDVSGKTAPTVLGLKEPIVWPRAADTRSESTGLAAVWLWLRKYDVSVLILTRHPLDVVASGKRRALATTNWPGYTAGELCEFWLSSARTGRELRREGFNLMILRWESIILEPTLTTMRLNRWLGKSLPDFDGRERDPPNLADLRVRVSASEGVRGNPNRELLSDDDRRIVAAALSDPDAWDGYTV
jgi:hypothetical protein